MSVETRCQWDKQWAAHSLPLPACKITHCVSPFPIPPGAHLEELTAAWTAVNTNKEYQCQGKEADTHTRFWETDRTQSTFQMFCRADGYYEWRDWPTCVEGEPLIDLISLQITPIRYHVFPRPSRDPHPQ